VACTSHSPTRRHTWYSLQLDGSAKCPGCGHWYSGSSAAHLRESRDRIDGSVRGKPLCTAVAVSVSSGTARSAEFGVALEVPAEMSACADCSNDLGRAVEMCKSAADMEGVVGVTTSAVSDKVLE
jgi:hypothetical protein